ncbi:MAG: hypothetical protein NTU76_01050 [Candidatus Taylorbacteria bacterium]|nr:hypothetical protein [Candidatus Taylorbacteria bacterium]
MNTEKKIKHKEEKEATKIDIEKIRKLALTVKEDEEEALKELSHQQETCKNQN